MQTLRKKTSPCKYKNEPSRFLGEGVSFKAKLIGILEVSEARGDRMCQEALADLKMAIRAAGEHKQRISINIAIDGLRLRDEKTGDCLYHHPVHKISFIAQDMSDSRAFGYIFGSPDTGHRFFGIKTDKAASQVVIAMRDLFQVVFELKKKEIEMAKQHIEQHQQKTAEDPPTDTTSGSKGEQPFRKMKTIQEDSAKDEGHPAPSSADKPAQRTSEVIADLLDLEFELNSIQQGIHQMERITPSDPFAKGDPFGDSFAPAVSPPSSSAAAPRPQRAVVAILPPPPSSKDSSADPFGSRPHGRRAAAAAAAAARQAASEPPPPSKTPPPPVEDPEKHWFDRETESLFEEDELRSPPVASLHALPPAADKSPGQTVNISPPKPQQPSSHIDVFMELDPLGTGRNKPYVDRKDFFQELKNPPKKVLKDLVTEAPNEATAPLFRANFDVKPSASIQTYRGFPSEGVLASANQAVSSSNLPVSTETMKPSKPEVEPFPTSNMFKTDPFEDENFVSISSVATSVSASDPFDTDFADFTAFSSESPGQTVTEKFDTEQKTLILQQGPESVASKANFHGPLRVSLPPEKENVEVPVAAFPDLKIIGIASPATSSSVSLSRIRSRANKFQKQMTTSDIIRLPSPKTHQMLADLTRQKSLDLCSATSSFRLASSPTPPVTPLPVSLESLSPPHAESEPKIISSFQSKVASFPESPDIDSSSIMPISRTDQKEIAPEPPPRPTTNIMPIKPPPLPPKRQQTNEAVKPPPRPPHVDEHSGYDYIDEYNISSELRGVEDINKMPQSIPVGTLQFDDFDGGISVPRRPKKESSAAPTEYVPSFPKLPQKITKFSPLSTEKISFAAVTTIESFLQTSTSSTSCSTNETQHKKAHQKASLDITLSQLTKTGLNDLAQTLGVSTDQLSKMTLQDFTNKLSKLTAFSQSVEDNGEENKSEIQNIKREKYLTLRESVDEEPVFKAEFEDHFDNVQGNEKFEDVFQNPSFDKYAVFRELIEQESKRESAEPTENNKTTLLELEENTEEGIYVTLKESAESGEYDQDRYAALRQICANGDKVASEAISTSSDKEETQVDDTLHKISHIDDTDSFETNTAREPTSIIETTIEEEDITTIESENTNLPEKLSVTKKQDVSGDKITSPGTKYEHQIVQTDNTGIISSDHEIKKISDETVVTSEEETKSPVIGWAKFDMKPLRFERPRHETSNEEVVSPWSSDGKDLIKIPATWQEEFSSKPEKCHKYKQRTSPWKEEDSEEFWEDVTQHPQHENGWSDGESFYDEMVQVKDRRPRRKKTSPWKDRKICRDVPSLEIKKRGEEVQHWKGTWKRCKERSMDEEEDEEEYEYNRSRPRHRGLSWDEERRRRHGSAEYDGDGYEYGPRQRPSPWRAERERRGSWESGSWDEEDRFSQREYADRWLRNDEEEEYRRRKYSGGSEGDYGHSEYVGRRRHRNYRDRSRESPWEEEYGENDREESMRYRSRKRNWPVRPNSASETRRTAEKHSPDDQFAAAESQQNEGAGKPQTTRTPAQRQSPFEDDFTLPETYNTNTAKRCASSLSSDVSDYLKSPFEEAQFTGRIESVAEEPACDSDFDPKNGKETDDVFLPVDNAQEGLSVASKFRREDAAFQDNAMVRNRSLEKQATGREDSSRGEKSTTHMKTRLSLLRADSSSSLRKSESVNIFVRETDPFDDDFFSTNEASSLGADSRRRDRSKANSDATKWTKTFDFFDFEEGQ
ncbi:protein disabled [Bacillus rossius redtenbacheri]|uniref:protein disabled n=1 Tax=Bacillus rossius redtenbacheri TaxID=93214 RepID=UPI002FDE8FE3